MTSILSTQQKALKINLDRNKYGTFAEIGAGQEVARHFFQAGGASGTVAKSMSAYDMVFSDEIYGKEESGRYVCRSRLLRMLDYEFDLLNERLAKTKGDECSFFSLANTVATKSYGASKNNAHGWIGVKFQSKPKAKPSQIIMHLNLLDSQGNFQQEALGIVGVNLLERAFYHSDNIQEFLKGLTHNLSPGRVQIDMVKFSGPDFKNVDNRLINLELVKMDYCDAILFGTKGEILLPREELYKKNILVVRGSFRPPTLVNEDIIATGKASFQESLEEDESIYSIAEITVNNLTQNFDNEDFAARVDLLTALGQRVLITNFPQFYKLTNYFNSQKAKNIALALGGVNFKQIFDEKYNQADGGLFVALGQLFTKNLKVLVYPYKEDEKSKSIDLKNLEIAPKLTHLYQHLIDNKQLISINNYNEKVLHIYSRKVLELIRKKDDSWKDMVSKKVQTIIEDKKLFGL